MFAVKDSEREREGGRMLLFRVVKGHKDTSTLSLSHFLTAILSLFLTLWLCLALSHSLTLSWSFRSLSLSFSVNNCPYLTLRLSLCLSLSHFLTDSRWTLLFTLICWRDPLSPSRNLDEGDLGKGLIMRKLDFWMTREEWPIPVKGNVCLAFYFFKRLLLCRSKQIVLLTKCCDNLILNSLERTIVCRFASSRLEWMVKGQRLESGPVGFGSFVCLWGVMLIALSGVWSSG